MCATRSQAVVRDDTYSRKRANQFVQLQSTTPCQTVAGAESLRALDRKKRGQSITSLAAHVACGSLGEPLALSEGLHVSGSASIICSVWPVRARAERRQCASPWRTDSRMRWCEEAVSNATSSVELAFGNLADCHAHDVCAGMLAQHYLVAFTSPGYRSATESHP
jgi:hypothetical protein